MNIPSLCDRIAATQRRMMRANAGLFAGCCPYCKSIDFRSVGTQNAFERAFRWLVHPYRCSLCGHHFCLFGRTAPLGDTA